MAPGSAVRPRGRQPGWRQVAVISATQTAVNFRKTGAGADLQGNLPR